MPLAQFINSQDKSFSSVVAAFILGECGTVTRGIGTLTALGEIIRFTLNATSKAPLVIMRKDFDGNEVRWEENLVGVKEQTWNLAQVLLKSGVYIAVGLGLTSAAEAIANERFPAIFEAVSE